MIGLSSAHLVPGVKRAKLAQQFLTPWYLVRILTLLEQLINPSIVLLKKSMKCIKTESVPRVRDCEASGLASVNV